MSPVLPKRSGDLKIGKFMFEGIYWKKNMLNGWKV
jgi:hypothetical protein